MMKPITGQYECLHRSGIGLDYFTSRIDRLTLQAKGRFVLIVQDRSRIAHAARSLANGQQISSAAPEVRREGSYIHQGNTVTLRFDDGTQQQGQLIAGSNNLQIGQDVFTKVSDSTLLPSTDRLKKDMEDIAKGLKIAGAIGGVALKAAKTIHDTIQSSQTSTTSQASTPPYNAPAPSATPRPAQAVPPVQPGTPSSQSTQQAPYQPPQGYGTALYCDQCGASVRPGKRFCNTCGARLE